MLHGYLPRLVGADPPGVTFSSTPPLSKGCLPATLSCGTLQVIAAPKHSFLIKKES